MASPSTVSSSPPSGLNFSEVSTKNLSFCESTPSKFLSRTKRIISSPVGYIANNLKTKPLGERINAIVKGFFSDISGFNVFINGMDALGKVHDIVWRRFPDHWGVNTGKNWFAFVSKIKPQFNDVNALVGVLNVRKALFDEKTGRFTLKFFNPYVISKESFKKTSKTKKGTLRLEKKFSIEEDQRNEISTWNLIEHIKKILGVALPVFSALNLLSDRKVLADPKGILAPTIGMLRIGSAFLTAVVLTKEILDEKDQSSFKKIASKVYEAALSALNFATMSFASIEDAIPNGIQRGIKLFDSIYKFFKKFFENLSSPQVQVS